MCVLSSAGSCGTVMAVSYTHLIMDNLYSKDIEDKKMLSEKCLELYLSQLEEAVKSGATAETEIFLPMTYNGDGGWHMEINDKICLLYTSRCV